MRITRFAAGDDGRSEFSEVDVRYPRTIEAAEGAQLTGSAAFDSPGVQFIDLPDGLDLGLHPVPRRQFVFVIDGHVEIGTPDGELRRFSPGDVILADDVGTTGHTTRAIDGPVQLLYVPLPQSGPPLFEPRRG